MQLSIGTGVQAGAASQGAEAGKPMCSLRGWRMKISFENPILALATAVRTAHRAWPQGAATGVGRALRSAAKET